MHGTLIFKPKILKFSYILCTFAASDHSDDNGGDWSPSLPVRSSPGLCRTAPGIHSSRLSTPGVHGRPAEPSSIRCRFGSPWRSPWRRPITATPSQWPGLSSSPGYVPTTVSIIISVDDEGRVCVCAEYGHIKTYTYTRTTWNLAGQKCLSISILFASNSQKGLFSILPSS